MTANSVPYHTTTVRFNSEKRWKSGQELLLTRLCHFGRSLDLQRTNSYPWRQFFQFWVARRRSMLTTSLELCRRIVVCEREAGLFWRSWDWIPFLQLDALVGYNSDLTSAFLEDRRISVDPQFDDLSNNVDGVFWWGALTISHWHFPWRWSTKVVLPSSNILNTRSN